MSSSFTLASGRRAKFVIVGLWLLVFAGCIGFNLPGKFADAEKNESSSFLPGDAESSKALEKTEQFNDGEVAPVIVAYRRDGGLKAADRETITRDRVELNGRRFRNVSPYEEPVFSKDGTGALMQATIVGDGESETIIDPVDFARAQASDPGGGLEAKVTGPGGISADAIKVFESINGVLLAATFVLVLVLLLVIYRSPIFLWIPLLSVVFAEIATRGIGYGLSQAGVTVNGQSSSILTILVFGAGTDYALLLVARYREELRKLEDKHEAMRRALTAAGPAIFASGLTVVATLLCLTLADVNGTAGLGPIGAMGIAVAMVAMLTLLPAALVVFGRRAFWPFVPRVGTEGADERHGFWRRVGDRVARGPRRVAIGSIALLLVLAAGLANFDNGLTQSNSFRADVESIAGQELLAESFPAGTNAPTEIIVPDESRAQAVQEEVSGAEGVVEVREVNRGEPGVLLNAVLDREPYSTEAFDYIPGIRAAAKQGGGEETLVGGATAIENDLRVAAARDTRLIVPLALVVVFLILIVLLRSLIAPIVLVGTVILSFAAALGVGAVVFDVIFGFPGSDPSLPLFTFIFLVALGVDYNIFLMTRVREETFTHGTREGMLRGLAVTGGVITAAGIVLAGTFSILGVLPLTFLTQIGFVVAFGVLLDTFLVRSVLVPALVLDLGDRTWWPSSLAKGSRPDGHERDGGPPDTPHAFTGNGAAPAVRVPGSPS